MRRFEDGHYIADIGAGRDADAPHLRGQCIRNVITVQIERRDDVVFFRPQQDLLEKIIGNHVLDNDLITRPGVCKAQPWSAVDLRRTEFIFRELVTPVPKSALGVFHDVALVYKGD